MKALGALVVATILACSAPAFAVGYEPGLDVPRPSPSGAPWSAGEVSALRSAIDDALDHAEVLRSAHVGLYAVDARDGRVLYARAPDDAFQPASTLKLLVGSVALDALGAQFRFHTDAVAGGPILEGTLQGPLIVRAGGDPFLDLHVFDELGASLAARGVRVIRGGVAFDVSQYETEGYPPGWAIDDMPYDYAPVVGALAFEENAFRVTVAPAARRGAPALVATGLPSPVNTPAPACMPTTLPTIVSSVMTGAAGTADTVDVQRGRLGCTRIVGEIPVGGGPDELGVAVPFPAPYAALALRAILTAHGIAVDAATQAASTYETSAPSDPFVLWRHDSRPLADALGDMWIPSDNLVAELLLEELGRPITGGPATRANGIARERAWLRALGLGESGIVLADGSGLSAYDRITPRALVAILTHDWSSPHHALILNDLPIAGVRGTLRSLWLGTPAERHVFAKTGTLSRARTLAGYVANPKHGTVIFAFLVDEWNGDAVAFESLRARVLTRLVED